MSDGAGALSALSSDLAFSVSFAVAGELLDAAQESGISEDELVATVLALSVLAAALPRTAKTLANEVRLSGVLGKPGTETRENANARGILNFAGLIVQIIHRIAVSTSIQLLASNVKARHSLRSVRIASLLGVVVFFLFIESSSNFGTRAEAKG